MTAKPSISYNDELDESIQTLIDEGVVDSRSEFFQNAAAAYLMQMQMGGSALEAVLEDSDDFEEAILRLDNVRQAIINV